MKVKASYSRMSGQARSFLIEGEEKVKWDKVFKNGPSKICGKPPLTSVKWYGLPKQI